MKSWVNSAIDWARCIKHALLPRERTTRANVQERFPDIDQADLRFVEKFTDFTMTSIDRRLHLLESVRYIVRHKVPGAIVECGVWRGGSMMLVADTLSGLGATDRVLYLFDTFAGMPPPTEVDVDFTGSRAAERLRADQGRIRESNVWAIASLDDVRSNMASIGYPEQLTRFVEGMVEETVPARAPVEIALLRLDTDWYESTKHELVHLFPRISRGGVVIIDDYGYWKGARKAVDEFINESGLIVFLHRIDETGRAFVKL